MPRLFRERILLVLVGMFLFSTSLFSTSLWGDISLPKIFSDHMVLQRTKRRKNLGAGRTGTETRHLVRRQTGGCASQRVGRLVDDDPNTRLADRTSCKSRTNPVNPKSFLPT